MFLIFVFLQRFEQRFSVCGTYFEVEVACSHMGNDVNAHVLTTKVAVQSLSGSLAPRCFLHTLRLHWVEPFGGHLPLFPMEFDGFQGS